MKKKCIKCKKTMDIKKFPRDRAKSDGYYHSCSDCNKKRLRKYFKTAAGIAAMKRYMLKRAKIKKATKRK